MVRHDKHGVDVWLDWIHHKVHHGELFTMSDIDTDVDILVPKEYLFVPKDDEVDIVFSVFSNKGLLIELFEGVTTSADGTPITAFNHNRIHSQRVHKMEIFIDPTVTVDGTRLSVIKIGDVAQGNRTIVGEARPGAELKLAPDIKYLIRMTADADDTTVNISASFYEVNINGR